MKDHSETDACGSTQEVLHTKLIEGTLTADTLTALSHVMDCTRCQGHLRDLGVLCSATGLQDELPKPRAEIWENVRMHAVSRLQRPAWHLGAFTLVCRYLVKPVPAYLLTGALGVLVTALSLTNLQRLPGERPATPARVDMVRPHPVDSMAVVLRSLPGSRAASSGAVDMESCVFSRFVAAQTSERGVQEDPLYIR